MVNAAFETLGLEEKHQRVYLTLVETGKLSATQLSKRTNIPRATLYAILELLIQRGIVSREHARSAALFVANSPQAFVRMIERERDELAKKERAAQQLVESIVPFQQTKYSLPKIQVFEGKQNIESMLYDFLPLWRRSYASVGENTLWGFQDQTFVETYYRWHSFLWETMKAEEQIRLFSNQADIEHELKQKIRNREVRPLPAGVQFRSSIWIYGDYIVMGCTRQEPHYCIQMRDELLASNLRTIFQLLWHSSLSAPSRTR